MEKSVEKFYRPYQEAWDRKHLRTVSTHITARERRHLARIATHRGDKVYRLLRDYLRRYISEHDPFNEFDDHPEDNEQYPLGEPVSDHGTGYGPAESPPWLG